MTLIAGVVLGVGAFYAFQVQAAIGQVAVDSFDPEAARMAIAALETTPPHVLADPDFALTPGMTEADWVTEMTAIRAYRDAHAFDPRAFSPYSFGEPIPDELFEAYLLVGNDASGYLADVVILGLQPAGGGTPIMVSLPRDLYVWNVCNDSFTRLNAGLGGCAGVASGSEMLAILVEDYTGIPIDHSARIDFGGFAGLVDVMGGTTICVDYPTRDPKSGLHIKKAGCQTADGKTTLAWVRSRHTEQKIDGAWTVVVGSDYARQERQQDVLFQLAGKAASFSSPSSLVSKLGAVASAVRLDSGWSIGSAVSAAWQYRGISKSSVARFSIAARNFVTSSGAQVLLPTIYFKDQLATVYAFG